MRLSAIVLASTLAAACAEGVFEDYVPPDGGGDGRTSRGGSGGSGATGGSGGSGGSGGGSTGSGGSSTGGSGGSGGSGATGGTATGGRGGSGGGGGSGGSGGGATGGSAGRGGSSGSGGSAGTVDGGGCTGAPDWVMGGAYAMGDKVRGVCSTASSGAGAMCTVGKTYAWSCSLALACGIVGPGTANWGFAWALGSECN